MNIQSAKYVKHFIDDKNDIVLATIDGVEMSVPLDPQNRHYAAILKWVADGNTIDSAD